MISEEYIFQTVNTVLYEIWDPCGPGCPPDEYYAYDAAINFIIHKDNNRWSADCEKQISDYLHFVALFYMGITNSKASEAAKEIMNRLRMRETIK